MKKSEIYHLAQIAVVTTPHIAPENKLEILRELMASESYNTLTEGKEAAESEVE